MAFGGHDGGGQPIADINVTPLVDVMLVLLVIFMVTAPILHSGVAVELPEATGEAPVDEANDLVLTIDAEGHYFVDDRPYDVEGLGRHLAGAAERDAERRVYVRADTGVEYGRVMAALDLVRQSGLSRVGLVTRLPDQRR